MKIFPQKSTRSHVLTIANSHLYGKNQKKIVMKSRENAKKPVFSAYFRHFQPEMFFFENRATSHFGHYHFASLCQKSGKTNEPILRKAGNVRTDGRTKINVGPPR